MVFTKPTSNPDDESTDQGEFRIRPMRQTDFNRFIELGLPTCAFMHGRPDMSIDRMRHGFVSFVREHLSSDETDVFVAENRAGVHVGQLWLHSTRNRFNGRRELWIWDITVASQFQRRGLGQLLIDHAKRFAAAHQFEELWLLVSSVNDAAISLYRKSGLEPLGGLMCYSLAGETRAARILTFGATVLRPLASNDVNRLHSLWTDAGLPFRPEGRDSLSKLAAFLTDSRPAGWGAEVEGNLVGAALISSDGRKGWIERLAVHPNHRRAGMARAIVTACMNSLKERGMLVIAALVEADNLVSQSLFEGCGFTHQPTFHYYSYRENKNS